jgi:hypothetical protein
MEEMPKKTKRLEKENLALTRKHDLTNRNILEMAEERTKNNQELATLKRKNEKLTSIINQMQKQGRGAPPNMATTEGSVEREYADAELEGTESEYEYDDEEGDEEGSDEGEFDEDTEEELQEAPKPFGPAPPPPAQNGVANGFK